MDDTPYSGGLAQAYDAFMRTDYPSKGYCDYIERVFERHGMPPEPYIADLGCGTGSMCIELSARGYDLIGIDRSPQMLSEARAKAIESGQGGILFLEQDICDMELYGTVGAFISTADSVNYITDKRLLRRMLQRVGNYLAPGGLFIFDVNTAHKLSVDIGNGFFYNITDDTCYLWKSSHRRASATSAFDLTLFTREGGLWRRHDEIHRQRAYSREDFEAAIRGTGLEIAGCYGFMGFRRPVAGAGKASYVIIKKGGGKL